MLRKRKITYPLFIAVLITLFLLGGCATETVRQEPQADQIALARQLLDAGDYNAAAEEFLKLAEQAPKFTDDGAPAFFKQDFLLASAEARIKAKDSLSARKTIALVDRNGLVTGLLIRYDLAKARIAALDQQPAQLITALQDTPLDQADTEQQKAIFQMRVIAFEQLEDPVAAARARAEIDPLLSAGEDQQQNRRSVWKTLEQLEIAALEQFQGDAQDPLAGWASLAILARQDLFDATLFTEKLNHWRLIYPGHPAEKPIVVELLEKSQNLGKKITNIALLLPQNGRFAQAGAAVRDGFLSAWYGENNQQAQPMVHVYDASEENILQAYQQAVEEGAEFIVGPLEKEALKALLSLPELPVTTLALNQLDNEELDQISAHISSDRFYQFGLSPELEAQQVADKAWAAGFTHALAITPEGNWGDRLFMAFKNQFESLGGVILEHQSIATTNNDFSTPVIQLLNIDGSQQRYQALTTQLKRKIRFEPRPRKDMDFIFLTILPEQARQIRPQLMFHRSSATPVLATSHVYGLPLRGEPDLDMEGVIFNDMPWLLNQQTLESDTPLSMQSNWPDDNAAFLRLFALGIDAYKIIPHLGRLRYQNNAELQGETGTLRVNTNGQVTRELTWAKFTRGIPQTIMEIPKGYETQEHDDE